MKKQLLVLLCCAAAILTVTLFGCARELSVSDDEPGDETSVDFYRDYTGTGLPVDHLSCYLLYVNGDLYTLDVGVPSLIDVLPEGFTLAGTIKKDDFYSVPNTELSSCHIQEGSEVYTNPDDISSVYVIRQFGDGSSVYDRYKLCDAYDNSRINKEAERLKKYTNK